jgi:hypothetical protein
MDAGSMKGFIRVNIPYPGQEALVQKKRLDRPALGANPVDEFAGRDLERLGTQAGERVQFSLWSFFFQKEPPELARVDEAKLAGMILKRKDYMSMLFAGRIGGDES